MPKYHDDPIKKVWRQGFYEFVRQTLIKQGISPKSMHILCMPGSEAYEITEVYKRLGIPDENIVALEYNRKKTNRLSKKTGAKIVVEDVKDFLQTTDEKFDIINLDYESNLCQSVLSALRYIPGRQLLKDPSVFGLTISGKRESKEMQAVYRHHLVSTFLRVNEGGQYEEVLKGIDVPIIPGDKELSFVDEFLCEKIGYERLANVKESVLTSLVLSYFLKGTDNTKLNPFFEKMPQLRILETVHHRFYKIVDELVNTFTSEGKTYGQLFTEVYKQLIKSRNNIKPEQTGYASEKQADGTRTHLDIDSELLETLRADLSESGYPPRVGDMLMMAYSNSYFAENRRSYKYTSENASLMLSDFFHFSQQRNILGKYAVLGESLQKQVSKDGTYGLGPLLVFGDSVVYPSTGAKKIFRRSAKKNLEMWKKDTEFLDERIGRWIKTERIDLGSSAKRPKLTGEEYHKMRLEKEVLTSRPLTDDERDELHGKLRESHKVTQRQLSCYEAHYTMETHGKKLEPTIDDLIAEIKKGKTWREIRQKYHIKNRQQVAAIKHWLRVGKYDNVQEVAQPEPQKIRAETESLKIYPIAALINSGNSRNFLDRMSENARSRMRYFVNEDLPHRIGNSNGTAVEILEAVRSSKWYKETSQRYTYALRSYGEAAESYTEIKQAYNAASGDGAKIENLAHLTRELRISEQERKNRENILKKLDAAVITFFDDVMLEAMKSSAPTKQRVEQIYRNVIASYGL